VPEPAVAPLLGVVASTSLAPLLDGRSQDLVLVAASRSALHLAPVDPTSALPLVSVVARDAVLLPNALAVTTDAGVSSLSADADADADAGAGNGTGVRARIGGGTLTLVGVAGLAGGRAVRLRPARWWDPRLAPLVAPTAALERRLAAVDLVIADADRTIGPDPFVTDLAARVAALAGALAVGDDARAADLATDLLGRGRGSTPAGDDAIAGLVLAGLTLRPGGDGTGAAVLARFATWLAATAPRRTGRLAAALLLHATRAEAAAPVGRLLVALGRPDGGARPTAAVAAADTGTEAALGRALDDVAALGHGSGRDLLVGIAAGVELVLAAARAARPDRLASVGRVPVGAAAPAALAAPVVTWTGPRGRGGRG
jgi:hypothetical protein